MSYVITKTDGTIVTTVQDGHYDNTLAVTLIGKNLANFGQLQNENFVHLLENFANSTAPATSTLTGQLWYDKSTGNLRVYDGTNWQALAVISTSTSNLSQVGNLFFDTVNNQLSIKSSSGFTLIGPDGVTGFGTTRLVSTKLQDISLVNHPVVEMVVDGEVIAILSNTSFSINSTNAVDGFTVLSRGITFKNSVDSVTLTGNSTSAGNAIALQNEAHTAFITANTNAIANSIVQRNSSGQISATALNSPTLAATTGTINGSWSLDTGLNPTANNAGYLGSSLLRWGDIFSQNLDVLNLTGSTIKFVNLTDNTLQSISRFDTDGTFTANADNRIATQKATKTYVDAAIVVVNNSLTSSVNVINGEIAALSNEINQKIGTTYVDSTVTSIINYVDGQVAALESQLNLKANSTYVNSATYAVQVALQSEIDTKASIVYVDSTLSNAVSLLQAQINTKANTTYVDATATSLTNFINAQIAALQGQINTKAAITYVDSTLSNAVSQINNTISTLTSRVSTIENKTTTAATANSIAQRDSNGALTANNFIGTISYANVIGSPVYSQVASQNGWTQLPNGILIQWGRVSSYDTGESVQGPFNFTKSFSSPPWSITATPFLINANGGADVWLQVITSSITASHFSVQYQRATAPSYGLDGFTWMAIGPA